MRTPTLFLICGLVLKAVLVVFWRFSRAPEVLTLLTNYDPVSFWFAEKGVGLFFDSRRIAPGAGEALLFELILVAVFGLECMVVGFVAQSLYRRRVWRGGTPCL
jgi:hypothetical protein